MSAAKNNNCSCGFFQQFGVLAWKNWLVKRRAIVTLLVEILIPTIIIIAIGQLNKVILPHTINESIPQVATSYVSTFSNQYFPDSPKQVLKESSNLVWRCGKKIGVNTTTYYQNGNPVTKDVFDPSISDCQPMKIAFAPHDLTDLQASKAASDIVAFGNQFIPYASTYNTFVKFDSADAFNRTILSSTYSVDPAEPIYSAAVIINSAAPNWDYTVRFNKTIYQFGTTRTKAVPTNTVPWDEAEREGVLYVQTYNQMGYFTLTDFVNSFIASETCWSTGKCPSPSPSGNTAAGYISINTMGAVAFPNPKSQTNGFWGAIGFVFALLMIISLLYPLSNVIKSLVQEKESKLREGMLMMAMREDALWVSWLFNFFCLFLPLSIILTIVGKGLFVYSQPVFIWFYFFLFFMSATSYCVCMSMFFSKSRTAAIVGTLVFFMGFFIYVGIQSGGSGVSRGSILAACLHPATAFTYGTLAFAEYEDAQIGVTQFTWNTSQKQPITFQDCLNMMFIDTFYLGFVAWYVGNIWPSEFGTHKPWYFIFMPSYWYNALLSFACCCIPNSYRRVKINRPQDSEAVDDVPVEEVTENLQQQIARNECVDIRNLQKSFVTTNGVKKAVDGLNLTMYSGQITALLGHNGAGKTTLIAMLTGLVPADAGNAIIEGYNIMDDMEEIRKNLGVCPQHDILFPQLTVEEHLMMFSAFKGTPRSQQKHEVERMIQAVGLTEKRKVYSRFLSGGQKRKLSVGIAFIGGSRVVFLDEPTSGMDPYSRRFTWNIIRQHKEGRVVVLTTHFMDEADLLGDRIAIMGDGKLRCCGSSLYLKRMFGVGYNMTIEKKDATRFNSAAMKELVKSHVPDCNLLTDVGAEMTFQLPFASASKFQNLFEYMDINEAALGLESYGMSVTTLEEVFIRVAHGTETQARQNAAQFKAAAADSSSGASDKVNATSGASPALAEAIPATAPVDVEVGGKLSLTATPFSKLDEDAVVAYFIKHMYAMFSKRLLYFTRDTRAWIFQYVVPVLFVLIGMLIMRFTYPDTYMPPITYTAHGIYNTGISNKFFPTSFSNNPTFCMFGYCNPVAGPSGHHNPLLSTSGIMNSIPSSGSFPMHDGTEITSIQNTSYYLYNHKTDYAASQISAVTFSMISNSTSANGNSYTQVQYYLHANYTALHSGPLMSTLVAQGIVGSLSSGSATVTITNYPLPTTTNQNNILSNYNTDLVVTFILLAIPFIPAAFATYVVREREVKAKHQQVVSGISIPAYWMSTYIWDWVSYQPTVWMFIILIASFPNTDELAGITNHALGRTIGLLQLFGGAIAGFSYLTSFCFQTPSGAQIALIFIVFILGLILSIIGIVLRLIESTRDPYNDYIRYIFSIFPPFALGDGLHSLALIDTYSAIELTGGAKYSSTDWVITGIPLLFLGWECFAYIFFTIVYEYLMAIPSLQSLFATKQFPPVPAALKDEDVLAEESRCLSGEADDSSVILVKDFRKIYSDGKYAVKGLSLGIPNGECFGLLGINGAGKSTTLSMLSGEFMPTVGTASLAGLNLLTDVHKCRKKIGFCPQFDALFELLTGREHLELYARIKGIEEKDVASVVQSKINEMGLVEYADRAAGTYSGGNKRKLSVAIAMIGEPSIVFLDEPSTGMDPVARRFMWEVISDIVTKREKCSLILTTHSMEECEALCTRIGIMVGGVLRCLGSAQRLRSKYGAGYQIEIGLVVPDAQLVSTKATEILSLLQKTVGVDGDAHLTRGEMERVFAIYQRTQWSLQVKTDGTGNDLQASFDANNWVSVKHLASWCIIEETFDQVCQFLVETFGGFYLRERQASKVRIEISNRDANGNKRKLSAMFGAIEAKKLHLFIQEYSISQTSLEQIFNHFASQQEEERGQAAGIVSGDGSADGASGRGRSPSDANARVFGVIN